VGALAASLTRAPSDNLVSRDHWIGYALDEDSAWLLRAGRIACHLGFEISSTISSPGDHPYRYQRHAAVRAALSMSQEKLRGELMAIAGNYQVRPDAYRERGYSGYLEFAPTNTLAMV